MSLSKQYIFFFVFLGFATGALAGDLIVEQGKKIKMDYTLTVNKEQVETSVGKEPLEFVYGDHSIIPGLEDAIKGMHVGEEKEISVSSKDGYGEIDPKAFKEFPKSSMPNNTEPKKGMVLEAQAPNGENFPAVISEVKKDNIVLDFNHPLAGKQLEFKIKILDIQDAPKQEVAIKTPDENVLGNDHEVSVKSPDSNIEISNKVSIETPDSKILVDENQVSIQAPDTNISVNASH